MRTIIKHCFLIVGLFILAVAFASAQEVILEQSARIDTHYPRLAVNSSNGNVFVVWTISVPGALDTYTRYAYLEYQGGNYQLVASGPLETQANTFSSGPDVVYNPQDDEFLVVWARNIACFRSELWSQRFDGNGNRTGNQLLVVSRNYYGPGFPRVLYRPAGDYRKKYLLFWTDVNMTSTPIKMEINRGYLHTDGHLLNGAIDLCYQIPYSYNGPWYGTIALSNVFFVEGDAVILTITEQLQSEDYAVKTMLIDDHGNINSLRTMDVQEGTVAEMAPIREGRNFMISWLRDTDSGPTIYNQPIRTDLSNSGAGRYPMLPYPAQYFGLCDLDDELVLQIISYGTYTYTKTFDTRGTEIDSSIDSSGAAPFNFFSQAKEIPGERKAAIVFLRLNAFNKNSVILDTVDIP